MKIFRDIYYTDAKNKEQSLDIYLPDGDRAEAALVMIHGGGLEGCTKEQSAENLSRLTDSGIALFMVEYRKITNADYPAFIEDCAAAVDYIMKNLKTYIECDRIFIGGSSAGAYISMMLCFDKKYLGRYGINPDNLAGFIFDAGQPTTHFNILAYSGMDPRRVIIDDKAPIYHICENPNLAPMLILCAENDMAGRYEQTLLFMSALKNFGCPEEKIKFHYMKGYGHCEYCDDIVFVEIITEFIKENI